MEVMRGVHAMRELQMKGGVGRARTAPMAGFLSPGCGFGGSCLPKDVKALSAWGAAVGQGTPLLDAVLRVNAERPAHVIGLLERALGSLSGRRVAVLGLAFKPDTDDCRESPAFPLIERLLERGASVRAFDPVARASAARALGPREHVLAPALDAALDGASAVVIMTRWEHFRAVPELLRGREPAPLLVDGRRMIGAAAYAPYAGVGLGQASVRAYRSVGAAPPSEEEVR
jgi:UDPglucose 6-dehydrogenase/GDP-mannose 6-dehydrogenase